MSSRAPIALAGVANERPMSEVGARRRAVPLPQMMGA